MVREFDERNLAKSRAVCTAMAEEADTGKRRLTERERRILDMWPRFEDTGDPVMVGDAYIDGSGDCNIIVAVRICDVCVDLVGEDGFLTGFKPGEHVKRPAPEVLDADGVPIKVGDTVWHEDGSELHVIGFGDVQDGETMLVVEYAAGPTKWGEVRCLSVTHTRPAPKVLDADGVRIREVDTVWIIPALTDTPDEPHEVIGINRWGEVLLEFHTERSTGVKGEYLTHTRHDSWERLEEDAGEDPFRYCKTVGKRLDTFDNAEVFKSADIVRRAKKLAEVGK